MSLERNYSSSHSHRYNQVKDYIFQGHCGHATLITPGFPLLLNKTKVFPEEKHSVEILQILLIPDSHPLLPPLYIAYLCLKSWLWLNWFIFQKQIKFLTLLFFLATGILVFLCLPSVFFQITEGWSYSEGIYFAFITLSTIGFGDYVVGKDDSREETHPNTKIMTVIPMGWLNVL